MRKRRPQHPAQPSDSVADVSASAGRPWKRRRVRKKGVFVNYPESESNSVLILTVDMERLEEGRFLNDTLVDFYIEWLQRECRRDEDRFHFYNTFFYTKFRIEGYEVQTHQPVGVV